VHTIPYAHDAHDPVYTPPWLIRIRCTLLGFSFVQAVDPVHAFQLTGMLLDAHMNLMTIDIVPLLFSPKMVRLHPRPAAASRSHTCMQLTQLAI
jgi:hypothetical protein